MAVLKTGFLVRRLLNLTTDLSLVDVTIKQISYCMMPHRVEVQGIIK